MSFEERMELLTRSIESHDRQIGELTDKVGELTGKMGELTGKVDKAFDAIGKLVEVRNEDATLIHTLAKLAESHDRRVAQLESERA